MLLTGDRPRALMEAVEGTQGPTQLPSLPWLPSSEGGGRWAGERVGWALCCLGEGQRQLPQLGNL